MNVCAIEHEQYSWKRKLANQESFHLLFFFFFILSSDIIHVVTCYIYWSNTIEWQNNNKIVGAMEQLAVMLWNTQIKKKKGKIKQMAIS